MEREYMLNKVQMQLQLIACEFNGLQVYPRRGLTKAS